MLCSKSYLLTLLRPFHSFELRAAPSHLLTLISLAVDPSVGIFVDLLFFQPRGLSERPLYKVRFEFVEAGLEILSPVEAREEVLVGVFGGAPAIVNAMLRLMFISISTR